MPFRALIVDDEPMSRTVVRDFLAEADDIEIVGEAGDGAAAVRLIETTEVNLVFLDIQMPELDGLGVIEAVGASRMPFVIFVTAYDKYALRAFEVHALDYLLKPFSQARFEEALDHARRYLAMNQLDKEFRTKIKSLLQDIREAEPYAQRFFVQSKGKAGFVKTADLDWVEAAGNYVLLHVGKEEHILRQTLGDVEKKLDSRIFVRVNRSSIISLEAVREIQPHFHGEYVLVLKNGDRVTVTRFFRERFRRAIGS